MNLACSTCRYLFTLRGVSPSASRPSSAAITDDRPVASEGSYAEVITAQRVGKEDERDRREIASLGIALFEAEG